MPGRQRDYETYSTLLQMSRMKHLIVEGPDDKRAMEQLVAGFNTSGKTMIAIDTADDVKSPRGLEQGNGDKVESLCLHLAGSPVGDRAVGFVDRGFRDFAESSSRWLDRLPDHRDGGNIVWTRGHSMENYLFDFEIARIVLDACITSCEHENCLSLFSSLFFEVLLLGAAMSVAWQKAWEGTIRWQCLRGTLEWRNIVLGPSGPDIDPTQWQRSCKASGVSEELVRELLKQKEHAMVLLQNTDKDVVRWMAHGHLGLAVIWAVCARCVYQVTGVEQEAERVCNLSDRQRFNACLDPWVRLCRSGYGTYPEIVLRKLGVVA